MAFLNPFGFSKQTETLLYGIGAQDLVKEFKKRNISTDMLHKLTKKDFMQLGADEARAENMVSILRISREKENQKLKPHERISDKIEILKIGQKQLNVLQNFITYCKCRLKEERIDFFIEPDEALHASQILCVAIDSLVKEVNEAESKLKELEAVIIKPKTTRSYVWYCTSIGISLVTSMLLYSMLKNIDK